MSEQFRRSHPAHSHRQGAAGAKDLLPNELPSLLLHPETEQMRELLEDLDDSIFAAIQGSDAALERAKTLWPRAIAEIDWQLVEESREHYLRFAVEVSRRQEQREVRSPENAVLVLEIISLLTKD
jgi:hypothetical protein